MSWPVSQLYGDGGELAIQGGGWGAIDRAEFSPGLHTHTHTHNYTLYTHTSLRHFKTNIVFIRRISLALVVVFSPADSLSLRLLSDRDRDSAIAVCRTCSPHYCVVTDLAPWGRQQLGLECLGGIQSLIHATRSSSHSLSLLSRRL